MTCGLGPYPAITLPLAGGKAYQHELSKRRFMKGVDRPLPRPHYRLLPMTAFEAIGAHRTVAFGRRDV
jgi:hypothetical protein